MSKRTLRLYITAVPSGEAPESVRQKWVVLALPLAQRRSTPLSFLASSVLSGPRGVIAMVLALLTGKLQRQSGYLVEALTAIQALEVAHPEVAAWWKQNTPHLVRRRRYFVFQEEVGNVAAD